MSGQSLLKSGRMVKDGNRVVIRLMGNFTSIGVVFLLAVLGSGAYFLKNFGQSWAAQGFTVSSFKSLYMTGDNIYLLIPLLFGVVLTLFPIIGLINIFLKMNKPKTPRAYVFDNNQKRFLISMHPWNVKNPPQDLFNGYSYSQLSGFFVRSYRISTVGNDTTSVFSSQNQNFVVSLKKKDGGFWDLFEAFSEESAEQSVKELEEAVSFDGFASTQAETPLTDRILRISDGGSVWFCWNRLIHLGLRVQALLILAFFGGFTYFSFPKTLPYLYVSALFCFLFIMVFLKGLWNAILIKSNYQCVRLKPDVLQSGTAPRSLFQGTAPNQSVLDKKFKVTKQIDLRSVRHVQYDRRANDSPQSHNFTFWTSKADAAVDALASSILGSGDARAVKIVESGEEIRLESDSPEGVMPKDLLKMVQSAEKTGISIEQSNLSISLEGLSIGEAIGFERALEEEINRLGGHAD